MKLITTKQETALRNNGRWNGAHEDKPEDFRPVVRLFCPWSNATWLLTELGQDDPDIAFGLCDLGVGCPEIGTVRLSELLAITGPGGLRVERDRHFRPRLTLQGYADEAARHNRIVA